MLDTFRISYRPTASTNAARLITAANVSEAIDMLRKWEPNIYSIRNITARCTGTKKNGERCERFVSNNTCSAHA